MTTWPAARPVVSPANKPYASRFRSFERTVLQPDGAALGFTQASRVIPVVRSSDDASAISTQSFVPSKDNAPPNLPLFVHVAPETVPELPLPDSSARVEPEPASKE